MTVRRPQATTQHVLTRTGGEFAYTGPARTPPMTGPTRWPDDTHLDTISAMLGLHHGYWLRKEQTGRQTTYTWVQL